MDALYPRLLVRDFDTAVAFWTAALRDLLGIEPVKVLPGYANWDIDDEAALVLFGRDHLVSAIGTGDVPSSAMLVMRVDDVEKAAGVFERHGAVIVAPAQDRPQWGPGLRTAHLRDPEGNLVELQSY